MSWHLLAGLPSGITLDERCPRGWVGDGAKDVFCMVKAAMSDRVLCQNPLLVFPSRLEEHSAAFLREANNPDCPTIRCNLSDERRAELRSLRVLLARDFPYMRRTLSWYDNMINGTPFNQHETVPRLSFLGRTNAHHNDLGDLSLLGQGQVPERPHELQVVFHRARVWHSHLWKKWKLWNLWMPFSQWHFAMLYSCHSDNGMVERDNT